jgi:arylsulfatase A-like enzyme
MLISIDTLRADHMFLYGYERKTSPFLDSLGRRYSYFTSAYSQGTWTLPSHWSMLTGLYPSQHGVFQGSEYYRNHSVQVEHMRTLPEMLSPDYVSYGCVNGGWMHLNFGFGKGFKAYLSTWGPLLEEKQGDIRQIIKTSPEPYFLFLQTYYVHNYRPNWKKHDPLYRDPDYDGYFREIGKFEETRHLWDPLRKSPPDVELSERDMNFLIDIYDESIRRMDELIEDFLKPYMAQIEDGSLVVIITSDHGEAFGEARKNGYIVDHHGIPYDEQCHVPLIITLPGGKKEYPVAAGIDIVPTVLEIAGMDIPQDIPGRSILNEAGDRAISTEALHYGESIAIRSDLTYIINHGELEVYDSSDRGQTTNLLKQTEQPAAPMPTERIEELKSLGYL